MAKNSVKQIQQDERRIQEELAKNANKSINDIAKKCGFSRQKVWRVIKNLEKNNTIWGYVAVVNNEKLNKKSYMLLLKRSNKPMIKEVINHITSRHLDNKVRKSGIDIIGSYYTHGVYDWIIRFNANDLKEAKGFVEYYNKLYEGFVSESNLIEIMFTAVSSGVKNPEIDKLNDFFQI